MQPRKASEIKRTEYLQNLRHFYEVPGDVDEGDEEAAWLVQDSEDDGILLHFSGLPIGKENFCSSAGTKTAFANRW